MIKGGDIPTAEADEEHAGSEFLVEVYQAAECVQSETRVVRRFCNV